MISRTIAKAAPTVVETALYKHINTITFVQIWAGTYLFRRLGLLQEEFLPAEILLSSRCLALVRNYLLPVKFPRYFIACFY